MSSRDVPPPNARDAGAALLGVGKEEARRFAAALAGLGAAPPLLLAVSGGADSMAMLALAAATLPDGVAVATVDHGLRAGSAAEAAMVAGVCGGVGMAHATLLPAAPIMGASLQARARAARYAALADHARTIGASAILTAHHADDAAETLLMRAARGSGLAGLAGVRQTTMIAGMRVVRPLLYWRRAELRAIARSAGLPFVDDPANTDERHDRTRFRRLLETNEWLNPPRLAQAAAALAAADAEIAALADWAWATRMTAAGGAVDLAVANLPRELRRRLARRAIGAVRAAAAIAAPRWNDAANIEPLLDALEEGGRATQAGVVATARGDQWHFAPAPPRRALEAPEAPSR